VRRVALLVALMLVATSCGGGDDTADGGDDEPVTIAFLRAVAGTPSTEPMILEELRTAGFVEGRNLTVLADDPAQAYSAPTEATEAVEGWVEDGVDLIIALSTSGALLAAEAAPDVDVLFISNDPTASGLVADEQEPDGSLTGVTFRVPADRTLSLARRAVPGLDRVGLAFPLADPAAVANRDTLQDEAGRLGIELVTRTFSDADGVDRAVSELADLGIDALVLSTSPSAYRALPETAKAAEANGLPVVANTSIAEFALLSLAPDSDVLGRQLGRQAARLLSGASPAAVPVEDPTRFVLTINAAVAADLGLRLDEQLLREADSVIE
jgi:putative ABC transport system substrate-binding protein